MAKIDADPKVGQRTLRRAPRGVQRKTQGRADRYSFLVGIFHPLLPGRFSRRYRSRVSSFTRVKRVQLTTERLMERTRDEASATRLARCFRVVRNVIVHGAPSRPPEAAIFPLAPILFEARPTPGDTLRQIDRATVAA